MIPLVVDRLCKAYANGTQALSDVSFRARPGEIIVLLGPNGSGKSTLMRCLVGLEKATSGHILLGDTEVTAAHGRGLRSIRRRIGFVFQKFNLVGNLSAFHNVLFGAMGRSPSPVYWWPATAPELERRRAMACLERVGLAHLADRRTDSLSGGEQQRVAIARMLMQDAEMVLADEPVASLDPKAGREVMDLLWDVVRERGMTVICSLHQLDLATRYADRLIGLKGGCLVLDSPATATTRKNLERLYEEQQGWRGRHIALEVSA